MADEIRHIWQEQDVVTKNARQPYSGKSGEDSLNRKFKPQKTFALYKGAFLRLLLLYKHVLGLIVGGYIASVRSLPPYKRRGLRSLRRRFTAFVLQFFIKKELRKLPFAVQLRRRLEMLGPTYIKLGQIMAIRDDLLPRQITDELKQLMDNVPAVPFEAIQMIIESNLGAPLKELFLDIKHEPIGSASIAQTHRATTIHGKPVVVKVVKPGIRETVLSDIKLLQILSHFLEWIIPRDQPREIINEFGRYTLKEIDLTYEADHAEIFAANFADYPDIVFPKIYREFSSRDVLCMEYLEGIQPNNPRVLELGSANLQKIVDLGAGAIIKMLYEDGFFHADLHAGNIVVLPGPKLGFMDLGMVGRFDEKTKRTMLYYFYALVNGDVENSTKYLLSMAKVAPGGDPVGFRRSVADLLRRYLLLAPHGNFSLAQLILESLSIGNKHRVFFPVEMTLMVKALVTFEGVGLYLNPKLNIPGLSRKHIRRVYRRHFSVENLSQQFLRGLPELVDLAVRLPEILTNSSRFWEQTIDDQSPQNPLAGLRSALIAGAMIIGGVIGYVQGGEPSLWITLFVIGGLLWLFGK